MAVNLTAKIIELLKMAGIDYSKMAGKIDPNKVKQLVTKTQTTATKPKLINALVDKKGTFSDALKIFEDEAQYISQMNEMELANFANNLSDYFTVGGKKKNIPSNVVTTEGTPVAGKKLETLAKRKGADVETDSSLQGGLKGLMTLVDEIKGITPKMRNTMDRDELAKFIQKMRGRDFTNEEIKWVREYLDDAYSLGYAKEKATGMQYGKKLGAKSKEEFEFVTEYVDNLNSYSPKEFKEMYGTVKNINMDISSMIDKKLEKHFKKKYKWDDTKKDGGLDDKTYELYESELWDTQKDFGDFHTVYDSNERNMWGQRKSTSWANHPNNYLDEASAKFERITGEGLNVDFFKKYTDDVLSKYPKPESFQYGGPVIKGPDMGSTAHGSAELASRQRMLQPGGQTTTSTGLNYLLGEDDNTRIPFQGGGSDASTTSFSESFDKMHGTNTASKANKEIDKKQAEGQQQADIINQRIAANQQAAQYELTPPKENIIKKGIGAVQNVWNNPLARGAINLAAWAYLPQTKLDKLRKAAAIAGVVKDAKQMIDNPYFEEEDVIYGQGSPYADGGRAGFAGGGMGRRGFLKFLGGTVAGIAAMKTGLVKLLGGPTTKKSIAKGIDDVVINSQAGAPEWFQPLVNKILREGKDANLTYGERQIGKTMDTPSGNVDVVYKMDTGEVELSFVGKDTALGEQVDLVYRPGQVIEEGKYAGKKEGDEFIASESVPEGIQTGKDDYSIDVGVNESSNVGDLASDLSELKTFATGEKQTIKEIVEGIKKKKTRAKMETNQGIDYITETQGDYPYASGGLAGMLGE